MSRPTAYRQRDETERACLVTENRSPDTVLAHHLGHRFLEYRENWRETEKFNLIIPWPLHLDVDTNYTCNLSCVMCPLGADGFPVDYQKKLLDFDLYRQVLEEGAAAGLASIRLGITGEPLLRPDILDFVRLAKEAGLSDIMLITNGMLLDRDMGRGLIDTGLTRLMVSLDAIRPETYRQIRRGGDLDHVVDNVLGFLELRRTLDRDLPLVRVSFVKMNINIGERDEFHHFWKDRADYISYQEYSNIMECKETDFFTERRRRAAGFRCPDPWQRMSLFVNGDLFPCCSDFGRLSPLGNAYHNTVSDVWLSRAATELRDLQRNGRWQDAPICRRCALSSTGVVT